MKKIFFALMSFCGIFSINAWAVDGELTIYGYPKPTWSGLMSGFAAPVPQTFYSTTYSVEAYAQMQAAQAAAEKAAREAAAKKKFCTEQPAKVDLAVMQCEINARESASYFIDNNCNGGKLSFSFTAKDMFSVSYELPIDPAYCRQDTYFKLETEVLKCDKGGKEYKLALADQCKDVK